MKTLKRLLMVTIAASGIMHTAVIQAQNAGDCNKLTESVDRFMAAWQQEMNRGSSGNLVGYYSSDATLFLLPDFTKTATVVFGQRNIQDLHALRGTKVHLAQREPIQTFSADCDQVALQGYGFLEMGTYPRTSARFTTTLKLQIGGPSGQLAWRIRDQHVAVIPTSKEVAAFEQSGRQP